MSSDDGENSNIDHTYNPYSFKKLEKAIFRKKEGPYKLTKVIEEPQIMRGSERNEELEEEESRIVLATIQESRKGKTDWTMDLPKINYKAYEDD